MKKLCAPKEIPYHRPYLLTYNGAKEAELNVSKPNRLRGPFENLFKVNTSKARHHAAYNDRRHSNQQVLMRCILCFTTGWLHLNAGHTGHKDNQWDPLLKTEFSAQHGHRKQSCGEYFQLVAHLNQNRTKEFILECKLVWFLQDTDKPIIY